MGELAMRNLSDSHLIITVDSIDRKYDVLCAGQLCVRFRGKELPSLPDVFKVTIDHITGLAVGLPAGPLIGSFYWLDGDRMQIRLKPGVLLD
jgi:hypothetical protein